MQEAALCWLTDPTVFRVNRLDAHSDHVCYASSEELAAGESSLRQSLDGLWRFAWSPAPARRPAEFWREGFDDSGFGRIRVPGHMELQGYGQIQYINTLYPWDGRAELRPPEIDWEDNPVGSYVRRFDLAPGLRGKRVCVSFQGVEQAMYVWLNGAFVGYAEDSFTPSEFDLTPYIRDTGNRLCVEVYKRSSAAWIEDQDFFRFSGMFRSVYLYAKPAAHLEDLWLQAGLEADNATGTLSVRLLLSGETAGAGVTCQITHPAQGVLFDGPLETAAEGEYLRSRTLRFEQVRPWCHETPELYHVTLTLRAGDGTVLEVVPYDVGFRRFELKDGLMLLNGERIIFRGVNRHEWNPETGRAIGLADMEAAMAVFRRNHINAVRTCHYPNQTAWYHLCDQNGVYMIDEANLESHGSWQKLQKVEPSWNVPGSLPEWRDCVLDRAASMFQRDKNHVSILLWSCGNESYAGEDILAMADFFRREDPSRLVHYEGVFHNRAFDAISDVESRMYASPRAVGAYLRKGGKPFLLCEYMHDMGNSLGGMAGYIRLEETFPQYQGGFIWDYMDQALWRTDAAGRRALGYGGDFCDRQTDYAFSGDGIVFADGTEKPAMQEVRYWYASPADRAAHDARNAEAEAAAVLPVTGTRSAPLRITHGDGAFGVRGDGFQALFSYPQGGPVSMVSQGREWLWRAPRPAYWRAPTDNDRGNGFPARSGIWSAAEQWQVCESVRVLEESEERAAVCCVYTAPVLPGLRTEVTYVLSHTGVLRIEVRYQGESGRPELPLLGLRFATPAPVDKVSWLGLSGETYPDRKRGGVFGWHSRQPDIPGYLTPQECGCHVDTHAVILQAGEERLTLERTGRPFAFSAIPYTPWQLEQAFHREELPAPVRTVVTVCGAMRGVGGIDSWGADVEPGFRISGEKDLTFSFRMML